MDKIILLLLVFTKLNINSSLYKKHLKPTLINITTLNYSDKKKHHFNCNIYDNKLYV